MTETTKTAGLSGRTLAIFGITLGIIGIGGVLGVHLLPSKEKEIERAAVYVNIAYTVLTGWIFLAAIWGVQRQILAALQASSEQIAQGEQTWSKARAAELAAKNERRVAIGGVLLSEVDRLSECRAIMQSELAGIRGGMSSSAIQEKTDRVLRIGERQQLDHDILPGTLLSELTPEIISHVGALKSCLQADQSALETFRARTKPGVPVSECQKLAESLEAPSGEWDKSVLAIRSVVLAMTPPQG